ncbi:hypothetical protein NDU88_004589 [Pleurodeles waltl]|uniref:Uncharacterized protein n=1 Tax=Pleurodeles waltl TaxID=8319 RepID=A0AAV7WW94_PLEWA|nr:hypothetical protein NDU88_004589 [Pleurodeles waltl]
MKEAPSRTKTAPTQKAGQAENTENTKLKNRRRLRTSPYQNSGQKPEAANRRKRASHQEGEAVTTPDPRRECEASKITQEWNLNIKAEAGSNPQQGRRCSNGNTRTGYPERAQKDQSAKESKIEKSTQAPGSTIQKTAKKTKNKVQESSRDDKGR